MKIHMKQFCLVPFLLAPFAAGQVTNGDSCPTGQVAVQDTNTGLNKCMVEASCASGQTPLYVPSADLYYCYGDPVETSAPDPTVPPGSLNTGSPVQTLNPFPIVTDAPVVAPVVCPGQVAVQDPNTLAIVCMDTAVCPNGEVPLYIAAGEIAYCHGVDTDGYPLTEPATPESIVNGVNVTTPALNATAPPLSLPPVSGAEEVPDIDVDGGEVVPETPMPTPPPTEDDGSNLVCLEGEVPVRDTNTGVWVCMQEAVCPPGEQALYVPSAGIFYCY